MESIVEYSFLLILGMSSLKRIVPNPILGVEVTRCSTEGFVCGTSGPKLVNRNSES